MHSKLFQISNVNSKIIIKYGINDNRENAKSGKQANRELIDSGIYDLKPIL